jgi:hypothetical protein
MSWDAKGLVGEHGRWAKVVGGWLKHWKYQARSAQLMALTGLGYNRIVKLYELYIVRP